jgi:23S rRNA (adenine2030-N6)-methyltransferase
MFGSGLFIINPPWTLPGELETVLPYLKEKMGLDSGATFTLESHIP